jgi:hypothetical protein
VDNKMVVVIQGDTLDDLFYGSNRRIGPKKKET